MKERKSFAQISETETQFKGRTDVIAAAHDN